MAVRIRGAVGRLGNTGGRMMDKRILKIILIMVCSTFAILAVGVGIKLYLRGEASYVPDQIKRADAFVERGQRNRAAELLLELKSRHPNPGQSQQIDNRLAELNDAIGQLEEDRTMRTERERIQTDHNRSTRAERQRAQTEQDRKYQERLAELRRENVAQIGGPIMGFAIGAASVISGLMAIGFGQIFLAVRDIAVNSYVLARRAPASLPRTPPSIGSVAPAYRSIDLLGLSYYVIGLVQIAAGFGVMIFVAVNL